MSFSSLRTYAPERVSVSWGGIFITGFAEDEFINCTPNANATETVVGAQGDVALTKIANRTGTVTLTLLQNADANIYLSNIYLAQQLGDTDVISANLTIRDPSGSTLWDCRDCHIETAASVSLSSGQNAKTWTFFCKSMMAVGANSDLVTGLGVAAQVNAAAGLLGIG